MKTLFVTSMHPKEYLDVIRHNCYGKIYQAASNSFQWALLDGFMSNEFDLSIVSCPGLPCFPFKYRNTFTFNKEIHYEGKVIGKTLRYCTLPGIKDFSVQHQLKKHIGKWLKNSVTVQNETVAIITYSQSNYFLNAIIPYKRKYPNLIIASIVTDLPEDSFDPSVRISTIKRIQFSWETKQIHKCYKSVDKFILLTENMVDFIPEAKNCHLVVEGIAPVLAKELIVNKGIGTKTILYAGTLQDYSNIDDFVEAFCMTKDSSFRLMICGSGPLEDCIKQKSKEDKRIVFKGMVTRDEVLRLQRECTVVVNPRKPINELTRYSFPSKTMEYMASGTPMIGYQLEGMPKEYYQYYYSPEDCSNETMTNLINEVLSKSQEELSEKGKVAKMFVTKNKSAKVQAYKIIDFLKV